MNEEKKKESSTGRKESQHWQQMEQWLRRNGGPWKWPLELLCADEWDVCRPCSNSSREVDNTNSWNHPATLGNGHYFSSIWLMRRLREHLGSLKSQTGEVEIQTQIDKGIMGIKRLLYLLLWILSVLYSPPLLHLFETWQSTSKLLLTGVRVRAT